MAVSECYNKVYQNINCVLNNITCNGVLKLFLSSTSVASAARCSRVLVQLNNCALLYL